MKCKIFFSILLFLLIFCNHGFADSYYFKQCKINENAFGNYIIDFENGEIKVTLKTTEGSSQEITDKIKKVTEDQVVTEKIQSSKGENFYFVYFLDANSKSVIKQNYKKISGIDLFQPDGPKRQSYCDDVKADWDKDKKETEVKLREKEKREAEQKAQERRKKLKEKNKQTREKIEKEKNTHKIKVVGKKWHKISKADKVSTKNFENDFTQKASELCSLTEGYNVINKKIGIIEIDDTPAFGLEPKVRIGIVGTIECK